jgi:hypothetical protein
VRSLNPLTSNGSGELGIQFAADATAGYRIATTFAAGAVSAWGAWGSLAGSLTGSFQRYRIVNWGVRVRCTQAPLSAQGSIEFVV